MYASWVFATACFKICYKLNHKHKLYTCTSKWHGTSGFFLSLPVLWFAASYTSNTSYIPQVAPPGSLVLPIPHLLIYNRVVQRLTGDISYVWRGNSSCVPVSLFHAQLPVFICTVRSSFYSRPPSDPSCVICPGCAWLSGTHYTYGKPCTI